ncbi:hypothetical protein ESCO_006231 [Escovopsis weberi]|uniref:F-box domain-containing protein n=1 Tax=Escovopsis weberi TaxID=150374 RepID=A0A0M8MVP9_ESCWE|nr:hypothetical protein ESCO_006231 [Escovopsis weberi]
MRELHMKSGLMRAPRRGWSLTEHQGHQEVAQRFHAAAMPQSDLQTTIPEHAILKVSAIARPQAPQPLRRPKIPPPRRSHSATDKEPEHADPSQPTGRLTLLDLPSELHYTILDFLDPIDGVCFGLAHSRLYSIHRRKNGIVPLSSRYNGPNDREWAWRGARSPVRAGPEAEAKSETAKTYSKKDDAAAPAPTMEAGEGAVRPRDLEDLRVRGQIYCRKCGTSRCELHRHLKGWFGEGREYCEVKQMYGAPAGPQAKSYCYMPSPKNPHRCGRHGAKRGGVAGK